jgi:iron complex transport system substrate-binding protein
MVPPTPRRIISVTPSLTELLYDLGAGSRVVGVTRNDTYPPAVKQLPTVGDMNLDYEAVLKLKPDLVVLDPDLNGDQMKRLQELGVRVGAIKSQSLTALHESLGMLGNLSGEGARGQALARQMDGFLAEARKHLPGHRKVTVFVVVGVQPLMTAGGGTYVDELVELAGGTNVYRDHQGSYASVSMEKLLDLQPEVIVVDPRSAGELSTLPGWSSLRAVKDHKVHTIDPELLFRPTMRFEQAVSTMQPWFQ